MIDPTELSPAELEAHGVKLKPSRPLDVDHRSAVITTHSQATPPKSNGDHLDRVSARYAAFLHWQKHGTLDGLTLKRSFPCLGTFRVAEPPRVADSGKSTPAVGQCDVCGELRAFQDSDSEHPEPREW
jgi:hypothetical protein